MAFLDNIFSYSGGGGLLGPQLGASSGFSDPSGPSPLDWLRALLSQNGGYASGAPSDVAVASQQPNTQAFPTSDVPAVPFGNMIPGQAAPALPPPTDVPAMQGPSSVGSYGGINYPIFGQPDQLDLSARGKTPVPAITQADIQQTPQQAPQPPSPDLLQRLQAGAINFNTGGNPIAGLFNTISGLATGQRTDRVGIEQQNQRQMAAAAFQYIKSKNPSMPNDQAVALAQMISVDPKVGQELFKPPTSAEAAMVHPLGGGIGSGMQQLNEFQTGKAQSESLGKSFADDYKTIQSNVRSAVNQKATLDRMAKLAPQAYQGAGAPGLQYVNSFIRSFIPGFPIENVKAGEEFNALTTRAALEKLGTFGTGISNADREAIMDQFPRMSHTVEGRMQIIQTLRTLADRQIQVGQLADQWLSTHPTMKGFDVAVANWSEQNPIFPGGNRQGGGTLSNGLGWKVIK